MKAIQTSASPHPPQGSTIYVDSTPFNNGIDPSSLAIDESRIADWPMVYILTNEEEAYVGQTTSIANRMDQHGANPEKQAFTTANVIYCEEFNTSVITDYEHRLIELMNADGHFSLTNKNGGLTPSNYFSKQAYDAMFEELWEELQHMELVFGSIRELEDSNIFKYSPFKALTPDQYVALTTIMDQLHAGFSLDAEGNAHFVGGEPIVVEGMPGTGKTVLAVYLLKALKDNEAFSGLNIKLLEPMTALRKTLRASLSGVSGISAHDIIGASDLSKPKMGYKPGAKRSIDIVLVDEAHRLKQRKGIVSYGAFDATNRALFPQLSERERHEMTELDWILDQVKVPIFFYDPLQTVRPSDVSQTDFAAKLGTSIERPIILDSQMRVKGGKDYLSYISGIVNMVEQKRRSFDGYQLVLHDSFDSFEQSFEADLAEHDLTRMIAGYAWEWKTKGSRDPELFDIEIEGVRKRWNCQTENWVGLGANDPQVAREVGCIHSIQGYDLSHAYVIIGKDLQLDSEHRRLVGDKTNYFDRNGKAGISDAELSAYIRNIYYVLLTRGIESTHVYVCDPSLREYFARYIPLA